MSKGPKFDKEDCLVCKYGTIHCGGYPTPFKTSKGKMSTIMVNCNYAATGKTCLRKVGNEVIDIRGDGPKCHLFEKGKRINDRTEDLE